MQRDVKVREVMDREFVTASESDSALATVELMLREEAEPAVVLRGTEPVGVISDRDVLALLVETDGQPMSASVGDTMTESVPTVSPDETLTAARDRMATRSTRWLVVSDGGEPDGVVTEHDVLSSSTIGTEVDASDSVSGNVETQFHGDTSKNTRETDAQETGSFDEQGICEACGSLTSDLTAIDGQLLCIDCRNV